MNSGGRCSLAYAYSQGMEKLKAAEVPEAQLDAWYLLEYVTGIGRAAYYADPDQIMSEEQRKEYERCIEIRSRRVPLQHITGEQEFMGFSFKVNEHVLIPRQDTEVLVECVLEHMSGKSSGSVLDMCTGSGCILLSLMAMKPWAVGHGADLSDQALCVARENELRIRKQVQRPSFGASQPRIRWIQSDLFENISDKYDIIVSNPPYIPSEQIRTLMPEVKSYEPVMALDGSGDGLAFYRRIVRDAPEHLNAGGMLFFEIGWDQAEAVSRLLKARGFDRIHVKKDLAGLDRVVYASWIE